MRMFAKFDKSGKILGTFRWKGVLEGFEHPYSNLAEGEFAIEVEPADAFAPLSCLEIHEKYKVDVRKKKLVPRSAGKETSPPKPRKRAKRAKK